MSAIDPAHLETARFHVYRSVAIQEYARLESALHQIITATLKCPLSHSAAIFYRLVNTRSRNQIIDASIREACGDMYEAYWHGIPKTSNRSGLTNIIQDIDSKRNEIVHWVIRSVQQVNVTTGERSFQIYLDKAENWFAQKHLPAGRFIEDLNDFQRKCRFAYLSAGMFGHQISSGIAGRESEKWQEVFQKPCVYPPPEDHPLTPIYKKSQVPPLPF
jgi:hypothetical protein